MENLKYTPGTEHSLMRTIPTPEKPDYVALLAQAKEEPMPEAEIVSWSYSLGYERATGEIESHCIHEDDDTGEYDEGWLDINSADVDLTDELLYLVARDLLIFHPQHPLWVVICDEDQEGPSFAPTIEPERKNILCTPTGLQTPEGIERVNAALEANKDSAINVANATADLLQEFPFELQELSVQYPEFCEALKELSQLCDAREAATEEMLRAVAGYPKAGE